MILHLEKCEYVSNIIFRQLSQEGVERKNKSYGTGGMENLRVMDENTPSVYLQIWNHIIIGKLNVFHKVFTEETEADNFRIFSGQSFIKLMFC